MDGTGGTGRRYDRCRATRRVFFLLLHHHIGDAGAQRRRCGATPRRGGILAASGIQPHIGFADCARTGHHGTPRGRRARCWSGPGLRCRFRFGRGPRCRFRFGPGLKSRSWSGPEFRCRSGSGPKCRFGRGPKSRFRSGPGLKCRSQLGPGLKRRSGPGPRCWSGPGRRSGCPARLPTGHIAGPRSGATQLRQPAVQWCGGGISRRTACNGPTDGRGAGHPV
jgi:hypothetical protein